MAVTMKNAVFWNVTPRGSCNTYLFDCDWVLSDVSDEPSASIIRVTRFGELGTTLATDARCENYQSLALFLVHRFLSL
jgi:hypothetical protein